jgi:hypothetical protein
MPRQTTQKRKTVGIIAVFLAIRASILGRSFRIMKCEPTSGQPGAREFDAAEETESRFARE